MALFFAKLRAPRENIEPYLGVINGNSYIHGLCKSCIDKKSQRPCNHSDKSRDIIASLVWPEVNFLVKELKYELIEVYEIYQYENQSKIFKKFMSLLGHFKLRYSSPNQGQTKESFCKEANNAMQFSPQLSLKPDDITPDKKQRSFFKQCLVSVLGKLALFKEKRNCATLS